MNSMLYSVLPFFQTIWFGMFYCVMYSETYCLTCLYVVYLLPRIYFAIILVAVITISSNFE